MGGRTRGKFVVGHQPSVSVVNRAFMSTNYTYRAFLLITTTNTKKKLNNNSDGTEVYARRFDTRPYRFLQ